MVSATSETTVGCMAAYGWRLFVGLGETAVIKLFDGFTFDCLLEFNVTHIVKRTFTGWTRSWYAHVQVVRRLFADTNWVVSESRQCLPFVARYIF